MTVSRRNFVGLIALAPFGIASASAQSASACYDPAALPASQKGIRTALGFKDASPDPARRCGACAFFAATKPAGCGTCALLSGGPVGAASVCNSFAKKS